VLLPPAECLAAAGDTTAIAELLVTLNSPDASANDRAQACEDLGAVGTEASIQPLADLLDDSEFSHYARYGLQTNPAPAAGEALLQATSRLKGDLLIGVVNSLGARKDTMAVAKLAELANSSDAAVSVAAAGALAEIGSVEALNQLRAVPEARYAELVDPLIECAERLVKRGSRNEATALLRKIVSAPIPVQYRKPVSLALVEAVSPQEANELLATYLSSNEDWKFEVGVQCAVRSSDSAATELLAAVVPTSTPSRQLQLLSAIESRGDRTPVDAVRQATNSDNLAVRAAAIRGLGSIGDGTDVKRLVTAALDEDAQIRENAIAALGVVEGKQVRNELLTLLEDPNASSRILAAQIIGRRRMEGAGSQLLRVASSDQESDVRLVALEALTRLALPTMLPELMELAANTSDKQQQAAKRSVLAAASRAPDRDEAAELIASRLENDTSAQHGFLCDALRAVGGERALEVVADAAQSPTRQLQNEATRVLGSWPTSDVAPVLLSIAQSEHPYRVRSLRGYLRVARQLNFSDADRIAMVGKALEVADRDEERLLAISILQRYPSPPSLGLAQQQLASNLLGAKAAEVVLEIAESLAKDHPALAASAAHEVLKAGGDEAIRARAEQLAKQSPPNQ